MATLAKHGKWVSLALIRSSAGRAWRGIAKERTWVNASTIRRRIESSSANCPASTASRTSSAGCGRCRGSSRARSSSSTAARSISAATTWSRRAAARQICSRHYVEPEDGRTQTLHIHLEEYAPGGTTQKHGHVNEAAFYILDGAGYEIHDGKRYDWKAGDVAIVHNNCVHQHFNASAKEPARALVIKTKPMYLFMNMLFQHTVQKRPKPPSPTQGNFVPRDEEEDHNHPAE